MTMLSPKPKKLDVNEPSADKWHRNWIYHFWFTTSQSEELQPTAKKQSHFLVPSWMKHCLLSNMWQHELNWNCRDTPHQKYKKISYNNHHKNAYVCPHTIPAELYQLNPNKHINQYHHQTLSKSPEPTCPNHLQNDQMDQCNILYETASLAPIRYWSFFKLLTVVYKTLHGMGPTNPRNRLKIKIKHQEHKAIIIYHIISRCSIQQKRSVVDRGFSYMAAQHWNPLPDHIKRANNLQQFKNY